MADTGQQITPNRSPSKLPTKSEVPPRLRHRSRGHSESENVTTADDHGSCQEGPTAASPEPVVLESRDRGDTELQSKGTEPTTNSTPAKSESGHPHTGGDSMRKEHTKTHYKSVLSLLGFELTRGYYLAGDEIHYEERRERVYTFMSTPWELEKFCMFGFLQCIDTFLFFAAFLPIRVVIAVMHMLSYPCVIFVRFLSGGLKRGKRRRVLQPAQVCDILKGLLLGVSVFCVEFIDTSRMYHMVRGQAVIKLYVFYNMLDLADRLVSGAGQDMLDSLYWTATEPGRKSRRCFFIFLHYMLALLYILIHTVLILGQATVLNVAFNSHNKALLTIMISNNFVEIKSCLFKRIEVNNLQQISCSDVKERFHYFVLLFVVFVRNMTEFQWDTDQMWAILQDTLYVGFAEVVVDWVKHAFITKFNEIPSETYRTFKINLAQDILTSQKKYAHTDYSDQVCRRLGLTPIPLVCLLIQLISKSVSFTGPFTYVLLGLFFLVLVTTKVLTSILLLSWGCCLLEESEGQGRQTNPCTVDSQVLAKKDPSKGSASSPARERHSSERSSPLKSGPVLPPTPRLMPISRSVSAGEAQTILLETVAGTVDPMPGYVVDSNGCTDMGWKLRSVSDTVVEKQSQVLQRGESPLKEGQLLFSTLDGWEADSGESDPEFHSSLSVDSVAGLTSEEVLTVPVVDYDDEKKFK